MKDVSIWAYPWDLHDIGVDVAVERMAAAGADMVSLATSYHAGRFLQPGNPLRRVYFPQDGTIYYRPDPARWTGAGIVPLQADSVDTEGDKLAALIDRRDAGGLRVSCWTVCLHNTRLGLLHPDHVHRNAFGDPAHYALCPSSPAAADYVLRMVREIAEVYAPDRIELESPEYMGFDHGFHHEKDGMGLLPEESFLLSLCFCSHCQTRARAAGVPVDEARNIVRDLLTAAFARELPQAQFPGFPAQGIAAFAGLPALLAYLQWRPAPVRDLIAALGSVVPAEIDLPVIDYDGAWWNGIDHPQTTAAMRDVLYCAYFAAPDRIPTLLAPVRAGLDARAGRRGRLYVGFQLFHPNVADAADLAARVAAARPYADGFNFYNLGLVPPARLEWIRRALAG